MRTSQEHQNSAGMYGFYGQQMQENDPYCVSHFHVGDNNVSSDIGSQGINISFQACKEQYFTLDSSPAASGLISYDSPVVSISSNRSPFSTQGSQSCLSDHYLSPENHYGSPLSGSSVANERDKLKELEMSLLGPDIDMDEGSNCCVESGSCQISSNRSNWNQIVDIGRLDLPQGLFLCAQAIDNSDMVSVSAYMNALEQMVSVCGDPLQRLGAYMLEGLRARLENSGSMIYRKLKCKEPTSSELMTYMGILYMICPYIKFAYKSSNVIIGEAMRNEPRIHIIDFQIAQGSQHMELIEALASRPGGPPAIRITGVDDSQSAHARGGSLEIVGQKLAKLAESRGVPFSFHNAAMSGCEVHLENLGIRAGEAVAVNFPYVLHHMPDESVSTENHRDRLLRLVKSLSPKVVAIVEQESNTNTSPFLIRFKETFNYYKAMFESIDVARDRMDKQRINAEQHCVARDIVNMIACEGPDRVERHELFGKWRSRLRMAGFQQCQLSPMVTDAVRVLLKEFHPNFRVKESDGALYLHWMDREMATTSAWR